MLVVSNKIEYNQLVRIVQDLAQKVDELERRTSFNAAGWSGGITNITQNKTYNANTATTAQLANTLGTLIADLLEAEVLT